MSDIASEVRRRRTLAIISHPDAGKTTLTEKLLLFSGAINIAGSVKARKAARHATSDWMEIEKQRGISVASSVMQMEYRDCVRQPARHPGHRDFSEDTYRVLTAVDAALMVIDAANGVEPQTRRLLQVCRARNTPIITFVNKMDREVQSPLDVMDEIERELGMTVVPFTWPVGMGKLFRRVRPPHRPDACLCGRRGPRRWRRGSAGGTRQPDLGRTLRGRMEPGQGRMELVEAPRRPSTKRPSSRQADADVVRLGDQQLRRARGARRTGRPGTAAWTEARAAARGRADRAKFSGVVFKIQANMDPAHRDRIAFVRVAQRPLHARHERLKVVRSGKELRPNTVVTFLPAARAARRGLCRRHHRHPEPRRAAARRHPDRGRGAAVHRPALLRARDHPLGRGGRPLRGKQRRPA